jgi:chemotaxis protein methyltransferase CheR
VRGPGAANGARLPPAGSGIPAITDQEFALFQALIHREAGIYLSPAKKALLVGRLMRRLKELGLSSFGAYYRVVTEGGDETEQVRLLDCICTNETHFFREPRQFEFLEQRIFPEWEARAAAGKMPRRIRAWSAACSTGEEPYSLAMVLLERFPSASGWEVEILATDLSTRALERARAGVWRIEKAHEIPGRHQKAFMLRGTGSQEGRMKAGPALRGVVRFQRLNLHDERWSLPGPFHLVFCRNVLIYFDARTKARVVDRLLDHLLPEGYLFLGHAEGLHGLTDRARAVGPTVYVHAEAATAKAADRSQHREGDAA